MRCWKQVSILKALAFCILLASSASHSGSAERYQLNVESQTLEQALRSLANASGRQLLFPYDQMEALKSISISGRYTLEEALGIILKDTSLSGELTTEGVILVTPIQKKSDRGSEMNSKKKILAATIGLFMGGAGVQAQEVSSGEELDWLLEEVVVTANKRGEATLQDTAMAISVLSDEVIKQRGLVEFADYLTTIPGASFVEFDAGDKRIVFRGLAVTPNDQQSTSGAYLGEMPMSSASKAAFDIKLVDIERIEVLKGPQGTLYGSSALGGTVRSIPVAPNLQETEGYINVNISDLAESDDTNQSVVGAINIPLVEDQLALRVAAYNYDNAGYIDSISTPEAEAVAALAGATVVVQDDLAGSTYTGARASLLWSPSASLSSTLTLGAQTVDVDGVNQVKMSLGGYQTDYLNTGGRQSNDIDYTNLTIEYDLGWGSLISSSSAVENNALLERNFFPVSAARTAVFGPANFTASTDVDIFSQELRLVSELDGSMQFLAGLFYEDVEQNFNPRIDWVGSNASENVFGQSILANSLQVLDYKQEAIFGEVSYQFNEMWELTIGGRHFDYDRVDTIKFLGESAFKGVDAEEDLSESGQTYKANLSYTPHEDAHIYVQWSEGFRLGKGQGLPPASICDVDGDGKLDDTEAFLVNRVEADTTENVELGTKFTFFDKRLTVNTSIFRIKWDNLPVAIQGQSLDCLNFSVINNIGEAQTQGIELETNYQVTDDLVVNLAASYIDTEWKDARPPVEVGERLVYAPRANARLGVQYNFDLRAYPAFIRTDIGYVGEYETYPKASASPQAGDYVNLSLRAGLSIDQWSIALYGANLTNEDSSLVFDSDTGNRLSPRKIGLEVSFNF